MSAADIPDSLFRAMLEQNTVGIVVTDRDGLIVYVNPRQLEASGYALEELLGQNPRIMGAGDAPPEVYQDLWSTILSGRVWHGELNNRRRNGEVHRELVRISPIRNPAGDITHFFAIKEEDLLGNAARLLGGATAILDPLTGLPNRAMLLERISLRLIGDGNVTPNFALFSIDLDRFRVINESFGHFAADEVLVRVAARLRETIRQSDMVARTGANEFLLLLDSENSDTQLEELAQRLLSAIGTPVELQGRTARLTASMGIARAPLDARSADDLIKHADNAMAMAKTAGGGCFRFYAPPAKDQAIAWNDLTAALRDVVKRDELLLHYQPKVDLRTGKMQGLEALVRWQHPEHGLIAPSRFIPVAEETGLIVDLNEWVIRAALRQMRLWMDAGLPRITVSLNLSLRHFGYGDLPGFIATCIEETGVDPTLLELEISEGAVMRDPSRAFIIVDRIKSLGVKLSLDDFGTGLSSLSYLSRMNVDKLKIDQSFVHDITTNPVNASIVAAMIAMAHKLGKRVIAVGVETEGQARQLRRHDCDEIQGYFFSRPVAAEEIAPMLAAGRLLSLKTEAAEPDQKTLLLVDDEPNILNALKRLLRRDGYRILSAGSGEEALELLATNSVQVIVSDQRMPAMSGVELLSRARELYPHTVRIILSGYSDISTLSDAINRGAVWKYISKPWDDETLKDEIRHAFSLRN